MRAPAAVHSALKSVFALASGCRRGALLCLLACAALATHAAPPLAACDGAQRIRLRDPVKLSDAERTFLRDLPPLRIASATAPPMIQFDEQRQAHTGIAPDVLCFVAQQTGLRYDFVQLGGTQESATVAEKIQQAQNGQVDVFVPLSRTAQREGLGIFTAPYYASHYAAIASKARRLTLGSSADFAQHRVGIIAGVAVESVLSGIVPPAQLHRFDASVGNEGGLFKALRDGVIDIAVFNKDIFLEQRYRHELFDLEVVQTLHGFPRAYGFYFSPTPPHARVVALLDRYLAVMDTSASVAEHELGERQLIERYVAQRNQQTWLLLASVVAALLALGFYVGWRKHRRLSQSLSASHAQVLAQQQALQTANQELQRLSQVDGLTGLANRRYFDALLLREHEHHQRSAAPLSVLMVDVDHFKQVNDTYGHTTGDGCLRAVAQVLQSCVLRRTDVVARYGGEEFIALLPETPEDSAHAVAERMRACVE